VSKTISDGIGIDWTVELGDVQNQIGDRVAIQGNLDPAVLYASPEVIETEVKKVLSQATVFAKQCDGDIGMLGFDTLYNFCHSVQ
jgi:uroporphyrinogen-III decarboxylase